MPYDKCTYIYRYMHTYTHACIYIHMCSHNTHTGVPTSIEQLAIQRDVIIFVTIKPAPVSTKQTQEVTV